MMAKPSQQSHAIELTSYLLQMPDYTTESLAAQL